MIVFELSGGLGNQMFQMAAAYAFQSQFPKFDVVFDISQFNNNIRVLELEKFPNIKGNFQFEYHPISNDIISRMISRFSKKRAFIEKNPFIFDQKLFFCQDGCKVRGYFQSEKYFRSIRNEIIHLFEFSSESINSLTDVLKKIQESNSVSLHIRRGDYISDKNANAYHGVLSHNYYKSAITTIDTNINNPRYFIFSDDINWAKSNLNFIPSPIYLEINKGNDSYLDMFLMSQCKHNIIANSSFSWWGAWLNQNQEKVIIAPQQWLASNEINMQIKDLIPESWIRL